MNDEPGGDACGADCVGYCACSPCSACGEMGRWTNLAEQGDGSFAWICDACWNDQYGDEDEDEDED